MTHRVALIVNGEAHEVSVRADTTLLHVLREDLRLTGARRGCDTGYCGACTVHVDGQTVHACCVLAVTMRGREVTTIEGLTPAEGLHPLQEAFIRHGAIQCGYCTPGMIMAAAGLLAEDPAPTPETVRRWLTGNLCRCTGYAKIVEAVLAAAGRRAQVAP